MSVILLNKPDMLNKMEIKVYSSLIEGYIDYKSLSAYSCVLKYHIWLHEICI